MRVHPANPCNVQGGGFGVASGRRPARRAAARREAARRAAAKKDQHRCVRTAPRDRQSVPARRGGRRSGGRRRGERRRSERRRGRTSTAVRTQHRGVRTSFRPFCVTRVRLPATSPTARTCRSLRVVPPVPYLLARPIDTFVPFASAPPACSPDRCVYCLLRAFLLRQPPSLQSQPHY